MAPGAASEGEPTVGSWVRIRGQRRHSRRWSGFVTEEWVGKILAERDGGYMVCYATPKTYVQSKRYFVPYEAVQCELAPTELPRRMGWMFDTPMDALCAAATVA